MNRALEAGLRGRRAWTRWRPSWPTSSTASIGTGTPRDAAACRRSASSRTASRSRSRRGRRILEAARSERAPRWDRLRRRLRLLDLPRLREGGPGSSSPTASDARRTSSKGLRRPAELAPGLSGQAAGRRTYVVEISRESRKAFLDEHPEIRNALAKAQAGAASGPETAHGGPSERTPLASHILSSRRLRAVQPLVRFVLVRDRRARFRFAPLQGARRPRAAPPGRPARRPRHDLRPDRGRPAASAPGRCCSCCASWAGCGPLARCCAWFPVPGGPGVRPGGPRALPDLGRFERCRVPTASERERFLPDSLGSPQAPSP